MLNTTPRAKAVRKLKTYKALAEMMANRPVDVFPANSAGATKINGRATILMPIPANVKGEIMGRAMIDHEAGHIRWSDPKDMPKAPHIRSIYQAIEDLRIEYRQAGQYPGAAANMNKGLNMLLEEGLVKDGESRVQDVYHAIKLKNIKAYKRAISDEEWRKIESIAHEAEMAKSSKETARMARKVCRLLKLKKEDCNDDGQEDGSQGGAPGQEETGGPGEKGETTEGTVEGGQAKSEKPDDQAGDIPDKKRPPVVTIEDRLREQVDQNQDKDLTVICCIDNEVNVTDHTSDQTQPSPEVQKMAAKRTRVIKRYLQEEDMTGDRGGYRTGKLDPNLVHTVTTGNMKVFKRAYIDEGYNTAVLMLLDRSSSMGLDSCAKIGRQAKACAMAMERLNVASAVARYRNGHGCQIEIAKDWHTPAALMQDVYTGRGGTPIQPTLSWASKKVIEAGRDRSVVFIFTDGGGTDCSQAYRARMDALHREGKDGLNIVTRDVVETMLQLGIEVYAFDYGGDCKRWIDEKRVEVVTNLDDVGFGNKMTELLRRNPH